MYLHRCERRPQFVRGVGQETLLRFQGRPQSFLMSSVHARDQRRDFRDGTPSKGIGSLAMALRSAISFAKSSSRRSMQDSWPTRQRARRAGISDQDRRGGSDGRVLDNFRANRVSTLGDLDGAAAGAGRVDVPVFTIGYYICKARTGLSRNVGAREGLMNHVAVRVPYRDGELDLRNLRSAAGGASAADIPLPALRAIWRNWPSRNSSVSLRT